MPPNERRRRIKIVANQQSRAIEISGGIKNALDRGEPLAKVKQSFINSGYSSQEVQDATQFIYSKQAEIETSPSPTTQPKKASSSSLSKKTIIILAITGASILIIATLLGLFWDKLF